jgi:hypothetical protein
MMEIRKCMKFSKGKASPIETYKSKPFLNKGLNYWWIKTFRKSKLYVIHPMRRISCKGWIVDKYVRAEEIIIEEPMNLSSTRLIQKENGRK